MPPFENFYSPKKNHFVLISPGLKFVQKPFLEKPQLKQSGPKEVLKNMLNNVQIETGNYLC